MMKRLMEFYLHSLDTKPLITKMISGSLVVGLGDVIAQKVSPTYTKFDEKRLASMCFYGFWVSGGFGHLWFRALDKIFGHKMTIASSVKKVCADQFLLAPPEIVFFLGFSHLSSGSEHSFTAAVAECLPGLLIQNYIIWLPGQFINFYYLPEKHRVLFMCFISVFWFALLSYTSHEYDR